MKKFWNWLISNPYIIYVGNNKYSVRVRKGFFTTTLDKDLYKWQGNEYTHLYCLFNKEDAFNLKNDYIKTKKWVEQ